MANDPQSQQESMFVVGGPAGLYEARDFSAEPGDGPSVNLIEQKIHLINAVTHLMGAKALKGALVEGPEGPEGQLQDRFGNTATPMVFGTQRKEANNKLQAKIEFAWASGHYAMIDAGMETKAARQLTAGLFSDFLKEYYLPNQREVRYDENGEPKLNAKDYRSLLEQQVHDLQQARTEQNRQQGLRPHKSRPKKPAASTTPKIEQEDREYPTLDTKARLEAIKEDPRAGFVPATHSEKNKVLSYLDYLDNPEYPLGINNQFFEVIAHQQRYVPGRQSGSTADAARAVESIVWEIGDYLSDAATSYDGLVNLHEALEGVSPKIKVIEEVDKQHPGLVPLVRHMHMSEWLKTGKVAGLKRDILRTAPERWVDGGNEPGKHKTIHSQYTRPDRKPLFEKAVQKRLDEMTVKEARAELEAAITNELMRRNFMIRRLQDAGWFDNYLSMAQVSQAVKESLGELREVA